MHSSKDAGASRTEKWIYKATTKPPPLKDDRALKAYAIASHAVRTQSIQRFISAAVVAHRTASSADLNSDFSLAGRLRDPRHKGPRSSFLSSPSSLQKSKIPLCLRSRERTLPGRHIPMHSREARAFFAHPRVHPPSRRHPSTAIVDVCFRNFPRASFQAYEHTSGISLSFTRS